MSGHFFVFSIHFVIGPVSYPKKYFKILNVYILVERLLEKLHLHLQWGPDTHNSPHQIILKTIRTSESPIRFNIQSLPLL